LQVIAVLLLALIAPILFALSLLDLSLRSLNYYKINSIHRQGNQKAKKLFSLLSSPERAISVLLFLRYSVNAIFYILLGIWIASLKLILFEKLLIGPLAVLAAMLLLEYVPRMLAVQNPERTVFTLLKPFEIVLALNQFLPLPQACERIASGFLRLYGFNGQKIFSEYSVNEIKMFLSLRPEKADGELKKQTFDSKFVDFSGRRVREVMVPRPFVKSVEINTPYRVLLKTIQESGYSRIPVYRSNFDNILGILNVKDIIGAEQNFTLENALENALRRPFFIPETATVHDAFQNMRRNRAHLAVVVDEYGGVDGIVTLEDLIEELLGEIHDEYDQDVEMLHKITENNWVLEGNLPVKELNHNLGVDVPENPSYTTVAGFLLSILDRIPSEKQEISYGDLRFRIEKMHANKIGKVSIKLPQASKESL
jgi:magnesium and cobalt exporter, CNNM family